jgi:aerobic-type carbon monoxide dehydrogenase small subunit (CoxS/CutS family)
LIQAEACASARACEGTVRLEANFITLRNFASSFAALCFYAKAAKNSQSTAKQTRLSNGRTSTRYLPFSFPDLLLAPTSNKPVRSERDSVVITLKVNGKQLNADVDPATPLLWVLRETLGLTGTKYGCGMAQCGACTVHLNGEAIRSCVKRVADAAGKEITTIEGLSPDLSHPLQKAWMEIDVPQCGYCQSGQIMSAAVLLAENSNPSDNDIDEGMTGNICRCGTYSRIRQAIHRAAEIKAGGAK